MFAHWCHPNVISMKCIWKYSLYQHPPPQRGSTERSCSNASASSERGGGRRQQGSAVRGTRLVCFLHTYQQVRAEPEPLRIKGLVTVTAGGGFRNHKLNLQVMIWPSGIHRSPINLLAPPLTPGEGHKKIIIILKKKEKRNHSHFTPTPSSNSVQPEKDAPPASRDTSNNLPRVPHRKNMHQTIIEMQSFV